MLAQAQPSALDLIPGARNAINYLLGKVADFNRVPQRLAAVQTNLINAKRVAESKDKLGYATRAALAIQQVMKLQTDHQNASGSVANALDQLRTSGLLAGTLDVAAAVVDAASKVTSILGGTAAVEKESNSISAAVMSPQEQAATQVSTISPLLKYAIWGGLAYLSLYLIGKGKVRGTRHF